jgi:Nuclease-related domain
VNDFDPKTIPWWAYSIAAAIVAGAFIAWVLVIYARYRAKRRTDRAIASIAYEMLKNVLVPNGMGGQIHINYLLLTQRGVLVMDLLERPGSIFGGDQMIEWTSIGRKRRYTFPNPQHLLYDRVAAVRLLAGDVPVEGRVAFTLRSEFPKGKPRYVLRIDDLSNDFPVVDAARGHIAAAFAGVWSNIKANCEPNTLVH